MSGADGTAVSDESDIRARAMEELAAGVVCYDRGGSIAYANAAARVVLGLPIEPGLDVHAAFGFWPHEQIQGDGALAGLVSREVEVPRDEGPSLKLGYSVKALDGDGQTGAYYLVLFRDLSEVSELRKDRDRYLRLATMSRLLATIAHEIKNPLAGILGIVEVLLEESQPEMQDDLQLILDAARQLQLVVDRIRLTEQRLDAATEYTDLVPIIAQTMQLASSRAKHRGVSVDYAGPSRLESRVQPDLVHMILLNLVNNSLDATKKGDALTIELERTPQGFTLAVRDTGKGMPATSVARATELFFTTKPNGTGIGLALSNDIVERSGGTLTIESEVNEGTTVRIDLPVAMR